MKLTKAQAKVIKLLQSGEIILHDEGYFHVSEGQKAYRISWRVWYALTKEDKEVWEREDALIGQQIIYPFNYVLTEKGKSIKL